jgi:regulator of protease activity HflC (stomatin/prohibitin superfamily)
VSSQNSYLDQVVAQKAEVENELRARKAQRRESPAPMPRGEAAAASGHDSRIQRALGGESHAAASHAVDVRITGWWRWKNVIVPPNAYVVHTRRGHSEPLDIGLGVSFRFDPVTDSFLVVPATMQTIIIHANCICKERQGVLVQGYVQWIIDDFKTAYRKLDFSDEYDPMRVVNVQLREQAEAAIKDKVATMSIDDVLADKQPIIKELTARLRHVAEGEGTDKGLGLRIVTVQIKEAVVCSPRVWETLQRPFRAERSKEARLAEITNEEVVRAREAEHAKAVEKEEIETQAEVARLRAAAESAQFDREQGERARRAKVEAETLAAAIAHEKEKIERESELARLRLEHEITQTGMRQEAENRQAARQIEFEAARRKIDNDLSEAAVRTRLIEALPGIAEKMPHPQELKSISVGGGDAVSSLVGGLLKLLQSLQNGKANGN